MSGTIHRFMAQLFHICTGLRPHRALPRPHPGIPDGSMDKLPSLDVRPSDRYYARDPRTQQFIETLQPQDHAA